MAGNSLKEIRPGTYAEWTNLPPGPVLADHAIDAKTREHVVEIHIPWASYPPIVTKVRIYSGWNAETFLGEFMGPLDN